MTKNLIGTKLKQTVLFIALVIGLIGVFTSSPASAAELCNGVELKEGQSCCAGVPTSIISCPDSECADGGKRFEGVNPAETAELRMTDVNGTSNYNEVLRIAEAEYFKTYGHKYGVCKEGYSLESSGIWSLLMLGINILTGGIMIAAIGGFIYSAVLYTTAGGNAEGVKKAKANMVNIVIGILAYALMYSFLNYLIPGGFLNTASVLNVKENIIVDSRIIA